MFSSRTPRDLNHDTHPWLHTHSSENCHDTGSRLETNNGFGNEHDPRPEFDHVQHNPPNPILVHFREYMTGERRNGDTIEAAERWLATLTDWRVTSMAAEALDAAYEDVPWQQVAIIDDHAGRVFRRIIALKEQS